MKSIKVPFIPGLAEMSFGELLSVMETRAARDYVANVNWPSEYPYKPVAAFDVARSEEHLFISYLVRGLDLKAVFADSNDPVWQDSCVEFFVKAPGWSHYFNFEVNCIGTCLASQKFSPDHREFLSPENIATIVRHTSLERKTFEERGGIFQWQVAVGIPFRLIGLDPASLPPVLKANIYKCADNTSHPHYLSWSPITHPKPNFHLPEFFGELEL